MLQECYPHVAQSETVSIVTAVPEPLIPDDILDAGVSALRKFGYAGATVERIAGEAGLSRVTLHRRGVSKDAVLEALAERGAARYREALWPALTADGTGRERLDAALVALCAAADENLELLVALRARTDSFFHEAGEPAMTRSVFTEPLERLLRDGASDGTLRAVADPVATATVLFNMVGWTYVHLRTGHGWDPDDAREATIDLALNGLAA